MSNPVSPPAPPSKPRPLTSIHYWFGRLRHNFAQKFLALLVAVLCWYFATEDRRATIQQRYSVAVEVRDNTYSSGKRAVSTLIPANVQVTLSGARQRLASINAGDIEAYIDVTDLPEGTFSRNVRIDNPDNTRTVKVVPATAQGQIDAERRRVQSVVVSMAMNEGNAGLSRYQASPAQVTISGPSRLVGSVAQVTTAPLSLDVGEQQAANLIALNTRGAVVNVTLTPPSVTVRRTDTGHLPVRSVPVVLSTAPAGFKVTARIEPPTVRLLESVGTPNLMNVRVQVPYRVGKYSIQPDLTLPAGVYSLDRVTVHLTVEER